MKYTNKIVATLLLAFSSLAFCGDIDVSFLPEKSEVIVISGDVDTSFAEDMDLMFVATSKNAKEAFARVINEIEASCSGVIRATLYSVVSRAEELVAFEVVHAADGEAAIVAELPDGSTITWKKPLALTDSLSRQN